MLHRRDDHARRSVGVPCGIRSDARCAQGEVSVLVHDRIFRVGMLVVVLGEQDGGAEVHRLAPPLGENRALNLDALDVLCFCRHDNRRNDFVGDEFDWRRRLRIKLDLDRIAKNVAR